MKNKQKTINCIVYILSVLSLISCSKSHESAESKIKIDLSHFENTMNYSEFVDSISYIQLETNDSCLISEIEYLSVANNEIFIKDLKSGGIFRFDNHGTFLSKLNKYGSGPGEFNRISSFDIDPIQRIIYIYDDKQKNILSYTFEGKYISTIRVLDIVKDFALLDNREFMFICPNYCQQEHQGVWYANQEGKFKKSIIEATTDNSFFVRSSELCCKMFHSVLYYDKYSDKVYSINKDSARCLYSFDLKQKMPLELLKNSNAKLGDYFSNINICPTNKYMLLFYISDHDNRIVLFNRNDLSLIIAKKIVDDLDNSKSPYIIGRFNDSSIVATIQLKNDLLNPRLQILHLKK